MASIVLDSGHTGPMGNKEKVGRRGTLFANAQKSFRSGGGGGDGQLLK